MTYTVLAEQPVATAGPRTTLVAGLGATNTHGLVFQVPASQLYFWRRAWQANERLAAAELACGEGVEFADAEAAVEWLLADD